MDKLQQESNPGGMEKFIIQWRRHFLDMMQPRHLPSHWQVSVLLQDRLGRDDTMEWRDSGLDPGAVDAAEGVASDATDVKTS